MTRYTADPFKYNNRVALALVPSLFILSSYAGTAVSGILIAGAMFTYIMDTLRWRDAALASIWVTLAAANFGFITTSIMIKANSIALMVGSFGLNGTVLMLTGIWASLQFKSLLVKHPGLVIPMERLLIACALPLATVVCSWGLASAVGIDSAPFPTMLVGCVLYALCMQPLQTSFLKEQYRGPGIGGQNRGTQLQGRFEGLMAAAVVCAYPSMIYFVSHVEVVFESEHFWSMQLLWSTPLLFISILPDGFWWISEDSLTRELARAGVMIVAGIAAILGFEGRVIFHSFGTYIPLGYPYNWMVVTAFFFLKATFVFAHFAGHLRSNKGYLIGSAVMILGGCAGGIAIGLPLVMMPAPLVGAAGFVLYYDSGLLRDYLLFCAGTAATFCWVIWQHFWFLEISVGGFSLHHICQLIMAAAVAALVVPGLLASESIDLLTKRGLEAFLATQAVVLTILEERLFAGEHDEELPIYPAYLVLFTSLVGFTFIHKLRTRNWVSQVLGWAVQCLYLAKLPMLVVPQANLVLPSFGLILAVSPPLMLLESRSDNRPPAAWKGWLSVATIILAVLLARMAIFDIIQALISAHPPEGLLLGMLVVVSALGCLPLYSKFYTYSSSARRFLALSLAFGALLCFLRPPVPIKGMAKCPDLPVGLCPRLWDERHVPSREVDDLEMYGIGWTRREHWPMWLLIAAVMTGLAAVTSGTPIQTSIKSRVLWGCLGGLSVGIYLGLEFFPDQMPLQFMCAASSVLSCGVLVLIQRPGGYGLSEMPSLVAAWAILFPVLFLFQAEMPLPPAPPGLNRLFPDTPQLIEIERRATTRAAVLAIYAAQALLISFAFKLKINRALQPNIPGPTGSAWDPRKDSYGGHLNSGSPSLYAFCGPGGLNAMFSTMASPKVFDRLAGMMKMSGAGGLMLKRLSAEGLSWVPTVGNLITIFCFVLCLFLNSYFTEGKDVGIVLTSVVLLLLSRDPLLFRDLAEKRRYFPVVAAMVGCLGWAGMVEILDEEGASTALVDFGQTGMANMAINFVAMLLCLPSILSLLRFLWIHDQMGSATAALALCPLNLVAVLLSDISYVFDIGVIGLLSSVALTLVYTKLRFAGQRIV